jgi:hypothetical protein
LLFEAFARLEVLTASDGLLASGMALVVGMILAFEVAVAFGVLMTLVPSMRTILILRHFSTVEMLSLLFSGLDNYVR